MAGLSMLTGLGAGLEIGGGIYSAITGSKDASRITDIQKNIAGLQMKEDEQRRTAMELSNRRKMTEQVRQAQLSRSMALSQSTGQGSQLSTGLQGAYGGISGQSGNNMLGLSQNLQIGENIFDLNAKISQQKMDLADAQGKQATDTAWGKLISGAGGVIAGLG